MPLKTETKRTWRFTLPDGSEYLDLSFYLDAAFEKWRPWCEALELLLERREAFDRFLAAEKAVAEANAIARRQP